MISEFRRLVICVYKHEMHGVKKFHKKYLFEKSRQKKARIYYKSL